MDIQILRLYNTSNMSIKSIAGHLDISRIYVAKIIKNKKKFSSYQNYILS